MKKSRNKVVMLTALVIILVAAGAGWKMTQAKDQKPQATAAAPAGAKPGTPAGPVPVVTRTVKPENIGLNISAVGSLIAGESTNIHSEIAGRIDKIFFEEGQPVQKGDLLLQIDKSLIETELQKANAEYKVSSATFSRDDSLKKRGFASSQKWDLSKSEADTAKSAVENARIRLQKTNIHAPFSGIVGLRNFSVGGYTEVGQPLTSIVSIDPLKLEFSVPEKNYSDISTGQNIILTVDAWPGKTFTGTIYAVDPTIDVQTRNFKIKATIPNTERDLRPGMYARITVETSTKQNVLMVPEESIIPQGKDSFVMQVTDNKVSKKQVTPGLRQNGEVEITDGLAEGDIVITAGLQRVREGSEVKPMDETQADAAAAEKTEAPAQPK